MIARAPLLHYRLPAVQGMVHLRPQRTVAFCCGRFDSQ